MAEEPFNSFAKQDWYNQPFHHILWFRVCCVHRCALFSHPRSISSYARKRMIYMHETRRMLLFAVWEEQSYKTCICIVKINIHSAWFYFYYITTHPQHLGCWLLALETWTKVWTALVKASILAFESWAEVRTAIVNASMLALETWAEVWTALVKLRRSWWICATVPFLSKDFDLIEDAADPTVPKELTSSAVVVVVVAPSYWALRWAWGGMRRSAN